MRKKSPQSFFNEVCEHIKNYSKEYNLLSSEKDEMIIVKHLVCGTVFQKSKDSYRAHPFCNNKECIQKYKDDNMISKYGVKNPSQVKEFNDKRKQTFIKKYGAKNPFQNEEIKQKSKETMIKKYGVEHNSKLEDHIEKVKATSYERYGVDWFSKNNEIKNKIKKTNLKRYGVEHVLQDKTIIDNARKEKFYHFFVNNILKYKNVIPLFSANDYYGTRKNGVIYYKFQCKICKNIFDSAIAYSQPRCMKCFPIFNGSSNIEKNVQSWLSGLINIKCNKRFFVNGKYKYELDVFIEEKKIGIELNGLYWHSEVSGGKDRNYHLDKMKWFNEQGIQIIQIFDFEWIGKQDIVKSIIKAKLGLIDKNIYARQCKVGIVDGKIANKFLMENHIQGHVPSNVKVGLFYGDELVSILTLGKSRYNKKYEWEILRFCNALNTNVVGGFSKMLKFFTENYKPKSIITYADARFSDGGLYRKNGFTEMAFSKPNYFYTQKYDGLESRVKYQKHKLKDKLETFNPELTEWENMQLNGFDRVWDCGNYCFVKN
jgi:hypothetical protein